MGMESWQKLLLAAGGAAAAGTILYLLFKDDPEGDAAPASTSRATSVAQASQQFSKEELIQIMKELATSQKDTSNRLKDLSQSMATGRALSFDELYNKVKASEPADPLETRGITMADLDASLSACQNDPQVMMALQEMMAGSAQEATTSARPIAPADVSVDKLTEVNLTMVEELKIFIKNFNEIPDKEKYDLKLAMICMQATLDAKIIAKYGYAPADLQAATQSKQNELGQNREFIQSHEQMQTLMEMFVRSFQQMKQ